MTDRSRVLFVDDEPHLLAGIRRTLHGLALDWDARFAGSGQDGLTILAGEPFDAVVSDIRMPGMDGGEFLGIVQERFPATARIVLSGQAERGAVIAAVASAHQFLAKPCDAETVVAVVTRVLTVRRMLDDPALRELIGGVRNLPTLPDVYHQLVAATADPDCSVRDVARIVGADVSTSAEVLKLTNSAFFGLPRRIETVSEAVSMLGIDNIQALVVTGSAFRAERELPGIDISELRRLALQRAATVRRIAHAQRWETARTSPMVLAAMLRDVGLLVLASGRPEAARELADRIAADPELLDRPELVAELEIEVFGCSVPRASAYLLGLWGFSPAVVQALAVQPVAPIDPGVTEGELAIALAHQQALRPEPDAS